MARRTIGKICWGAGLVAIAFTLAFLTFARGLPLAERFEGTVALYVLIGAVALLAEYVDSSLGMGYGTALTPILIIFGFPPLAIVPCVLLSEFISGITAGLFHHRLGNVDLRPGTRASRIMAILAACSLAGTVAAVFVAVKLPSRTVQTYIGAMVVAIGLFVLLGPRFFRGFSWGRIVGLGLVAAFNKGISGGGYGPLVTGGQVLAGVPEKNAIGVTSFAEGLVCLVGLILYIAKQGELDARLALPLVIGAGLSVPAAAWTVMVLPPALLRRTIGIASLYLGALTLLKASFRA